MFPCDVGPFSQAAASNYALGMSKNTYRITNGLFFVAAFAMIATISQGVSSFLLLSSLLLIITQGKSVPLMACLAVLLGATFPIVGGLVAGGLILYVMFHPTRSAYSRTTRPSPPTG